MDGSVSQSIPDALSFNDIIVPTVDTVRCGKLMQLLVTHNKHLLFVGPIGKDKHTMRQAGITCQERLLAAPPPQGPRTAA